MRDLKDKLAKLAREMHGYEPDVYLSKAWELIEPELLAFTDSEARLREELQQWRGYASFLAVHGIKPPTPKGKD